MEKTKNVKMQKPVDLSFEVNKEGLTGKDLLVSLLGEFQKHGLFVAGCIVSKDPEMALEIFGHQSKDSTQNWAISAMKYAVEKYNNAAEIQEERFSGKEN